MTKILDKNFFAKPATQVAENILGKYIVRRINGKEAALMIFETEAYCGFDDKASHASRGLTARNAVMFGGPANLYIYFVYGMHWMINIVCGNSGFPSAVLFRGAGNIYGPARLTKSLKIDGRLNAKSANPKNGLWFEDRGVKVSKNDIKRLPRVGIDYAGPAWSRKPLRFVYDKNL